MNPADLAASSARSMRGVMQPSVVGSFTLQLCGAVPPDEEPPPDEPLSPLPDPDSARAACLAASAKARSACCLRACMTASCRRCSAISRSTAALAEAAASRVRTRARTCLSWFAATADRVTARSRKPSGESLLSSAVSGPSRPVR